MKKYTIHPQENISESFDLVVTPTVKELRIEIKKAFKKWERKTEVSNDTAGMFSPMTQYSKGMFPGIFTSSTFGTMFLAEEMLGAGYVAHECIHAAMCHERTRICFDMNYGDDCNEHEERLAYYHMDCVKAVWNTLIDNGHVKKASR